MNKITLKKDLVIPAGTTFSNIDGTRRDFASGNFEATIGLTRSTTGSIVMGFEKELLEEWFVEDSQ